MLYHWRSTPVSTAEHPTAKMYAYEAGKRAVEEHLKRTGIKRKDVLPKLREEVLGEE